MIIGNSSDPTIDPIEKRTKQPPQDLFFDKKIEKTQKYLPKGLTEKILSQKDRIEGERKRVTVMFCDMEGFTPLVDMLVLLLMAWSFRLPSW